MFFVSALMATVTASATPRCVALTHPSRPSESLVQVGYPSLPESLLYLFSSPASTANVTAYVTRGAFPAHPSRFRGEFPALRIAHLGARPSLSSTLPSRLALLSEQAKSFAPSLIRVAAAGQHPGPVQPAAADADDPRQHAERLQHQQGPEKGRSSESSESFIRVVHVFPRPVWAGSGSLIRVDVFPACVCARVCARARVRRRGDDVVPSVPMSVSCVRARARAAVRWRRRPCTASSSCASRPTVSGHVPPSAPATLPHRMPTTPLRTPPCLGSRTSSRARRSLAFVALARSESSFLRPWSVAFTRLRARGSPV